MITTNIIQRVFRIFHNGKTASGYTVEKGRNQFLISAAHVFEGSLEIPSVKVFQNRAWRDVPVQPVFNDREHADTIVFRLESDLSPRHEILLGPAGATLGQWAYFLGFPFGMASPSGELNNRFPFPFVKAALISCIDFEKHGLTTLFLDGHNNKGFSGGPVVYMDSGIPRVIGTVSGYLTENPIHPETLDDMRDFGTNAGIIEAFWVKDILSGLPNQ